jgi:hypothetical protein
MFLENFTQWFSPEKSLTKVFESYYDDGIEDVEIRCQKDIDELLKKVAKGNLFLDWEKSVKPFLNYQLRDDVIHLLPLETPGFQMRGRNMYIPQIRIYKIHLQRLHKEKV